MTLRLIAVRVGVVASVIALCLVGIGRLDDAVAVFDFHADANARATFGERTYPDLAQLPEGRKVLEDARLWMPEDAGYRVIAGPRSSTADIGSVRTFLAVLLMPRDKTQLASTPWVFCHGCAPTTLGPEYEVLSDSGEGFLFARRTS